MHYIGNDYFIKNNPIFDMGAGLIATRCKFTMGYYNDIVQETISNIKKIITNSNLHLTDLEINYFRIGFDEILLLNLYEPILNFEYTYEIKDRNCQIRFKNAGAIINKLGIVKYDIVDDSFENKNVVDISNSIDNYKITKQHAEILEYHILGLEQNIYNMYNFDRQDNVYDKYVFDNKFIYIGDMSIILNTPFMIGYNQDKKKYDYKLIDWLFNFYGINMQQAGGKYLNNLYLATKSDYLRINVV
jgi:hypothetical protein